MTHAEHMEAPMKTGYLNLCSGLADSGEANPSLLRKRLGPFDSLHDRSLRMP